MFNRNLFKAAVVKNGLTLKQVAEKIGVAEPTLYRKMSGESDFSRQEIVELKKILNLTESEAYSIFFTP